MPRYALLALLLTAAPAVAQDLAAQYAAAARAFTLPGAPSLSMGDLLEEDAVEALLPTVEGNWTPALTLFPDPANVDPELLAESCERIPSTLVQTAPHSFELRRSSERDGTAITMAIRHDWIVGNTFDRGVEEKEVSAFLGFDRLDDLSTGMMTLPGLRGQVVLFQPSPDILVFVSPGGPPEIFARCPA